MRFRAFAAAAVLPLMLGCSSSTAAPPATSGNADWPMFRGNLLRDGHAPGATLTARKAAGLHEVWRQAPGGAIDGTPVVAGDTVVVSTESGTLAAFTLKTGAPRWSVGGLGEIRGSPAVAGDVVVAGTTKGHVYGLRLSDGHRLWDWKAPRDQTAVWSSPAISGSRVVFGLASPYGDSPLVPGGVVALDLGTGKLLWSLCTMLACAPGGGVWSSVAIDEGGRGFVGVGNPVDGVVSFDVATGSVRWTTIFHPDAGRDLDVGATPIVFSIAGREEVAVGSTAGVFDVLDATTGAVVWSRFVVPGSSVHGLIASPAFDGSLLFVPSASTPTGMTALAPSDGSIQWQQLTDLPIYSAPALGADVLVFGTGDVFGDAHSGRLVALATRDGSAVWGQDMRSSVFSAPAIAGDVVLVGDTQGALVAFGPS